MSKPNNYKLEDLIWTKPNSLSPELCDLIIKKFESDSRLRIGSTLKGIDETTKKTTDLSISKFNDWEIEDTKLFEILLFELEEYNKYIKSVNELLDYSINGYISTSDSGYQLQRYDNNQESPGFYDWHNDFSLDINGVRMLTFMWYLNDVEIGGETEFMNDMKIKPETGKLVIFPAQWQYLHRALPPISDKKWICTGWTYSQLSKLPEESSI